MTSPALPLLPQRATTQKKRAMILTGFFLSHSPDPLHLPPRVLLPTPISPLRCMPTTSSASPPPSPLCRTTTCPQPDAHHHLPPPRASHLLRHTPPLSLSRTTPYSQEPRPPIPFRH